MTIIIGAPRGIPFLRVQPTGPVVVQHIERPTQIEVLAGSFITRGGRYLVTLMDDGEVRLGAVIEGADGEPYELVSGRAPNGVMLPLEVDRVVRESVRILDLVQ